MAADPPLSPRARLLRRSALGVVVLFLAATAVALVLRAGDAGSTLPAVDVPDAAAKGTVVRRYPLRSAAAGRRLVQTTVAPAGDLHGRPLLVLLHGKAQDPAVLARNPLRAAIVDLGGRAPVVLLPADDGGSYWHDRRSGDWERYVLREAIPAAIRRYGLDPDRIAVGGISMGGAGAFAIARAAPGRFCAVGGHSPALWTSAGATAPGAYDDAEDFAAHDPVGPAVRGTGRRYGVPLWIDAGGEDPFLAADRTFVAALRARGERVTSPVWAGGHENRYWQRHMGRYLRFYADALASCRRD